MSLIVMLFAVMNLVGVLMTIYGLTNCRVFYIILGLLLVGCNSWFFYLTLSLLKR